MRSISTRFAVAVGAFVILFSGFAVFRTWALIRQHTEEGMAQQAELALQFDLAIRSYVRDEIRPIMEKHIGKDDFIPETMSTSYVARSIFENVDKKFPDYIIKFSSDNPRNPANAAGPEELKILQYFQDTPKAKEWKKVQTSRGPKPNQPSVRSNRRATLAWLSGAPLGRPVEPEV